MDLSELKRIANELGAEITIRISPDIEPIVIDGDSEEIKELIENLPLADEDQELIKSDWITVREVASYFAYPDKDACRTVRTECENGKFYCRKKSGGKIWQISSASCVLLMHGVEDPRLVRV